MNVTRIPRFVSTAVLGLAALSASIVRAQQPATPAQTTPAQPATSRVVRIVAEPATLALVAGQAVPFTLTAYDSAGKVIENPPLRTSGVRGVLRYANGQVTATKAGKYELVVTSVG